MNEFPQEIVDFDNKAKKIFFSLYENFAQSAKQLDRKRDDNVFDQRLFKWVHAKIKIAIKFSFRKGTYRQLYLNIAQTW